MKTFKLISQYNMFMLVWNNFVLYHTQSDWDRPILASMLGLWFPPSNLTDGTIDCPITKLTASEMIESATKILYENINCRFNTKYIELPDQSNWTYLKEPKIID